MGIEALAKVFGLGIRINKEKKVFKKIDVLIIL